MYSNLPLEYSTPAQVYPDNNNNGISLVKELSPQEHLREMMQWLNGKVWDDKKQTYTELPGAKPFMNNEGMNMFFHQATSVISPIVTMSNYTKDYARIHNLMLMLVKRATIHFHLHYKDYGMTRKTQIAMISDKLLILGLSAFYKAIGAGDRKASTSNIHENISTLMRPQGDPYPQQNKSKGFLSRMNPFGK